MRLAALVLVLAAGGVVACGDPVVDAQIAALPGEVPGIRTGPMHRGGQPCTLCHSAYGGRHPQFTVAGTLYQKPTNRVPVEGAAVHVTDATGAMRDLITNCAGNFYVADTEWQPTFPLKVDISDPATGEAKTMVTKIGRDASCAFCHVDPAGTDSPGHVYLTADAGVPDMTPPALSCGFR
jgi:hypothetical protein